MPEKDGEKRKGRFIKKESALYSKLNIKPFSFNEVVNKKLAFFDNSRSNIIFTRLHESENLNQVVLDNMINHSLADPHADPTIRVRDFTPDWIEQKKKAKKKLDVEEEEEDDDDHSVEAILSTTEGHTEPEKAHELKKESATPPDKETDTASFIKEEKEHTPPIAQVDTKLAELQTPQKEHAHSLSITPEKKEAVSQENKAVETILDQNTKNIEELEKAVNKSFQDGFEQGSSAEQKKLQETFQKTFSEIEKLKKNIESTKRQILENAQENFHVLATAICEAIAEKKVSLDKNILLDLIKKALLKITDDTIKIFVHPDFYLDLKTMIDDSSFLAQFEKDISLEKNSFRIQTQTSEISSSIKEIVRELIANADLKLFEEDIKS